LIRLNEKDFFKQFKNKEDFHSFFNDLANPKDDLGNSIDDFG
jgi:hypothetical protein